MSTDDRDGLREVPGARGGEPGDDAILRKGVGESFNGEAACRWRFSDDLLICQRQCNQIRGTEIGSRRRFPVVWLTEKIKTILTSRISSYSHL